MVKQITSLELKAFAGKDGSYLIDVRTPEEWKNVGRPDGEALGLVTHFVSYQFQEGDGRVLNPDFEKEQAKISSCSGGNSFILESIFNNFTQ